MKQTDQQSDEQFDNLLREIGPDVPQPALDEHARARLVQSIDAAVAQATLVRIGRPPGWMVKAGAAIAAVLALACGVLWIRLERVSDQLVSSRWQTDEALQLLRSARLTQKPIPVPDHLEGLNPSDIMLITFHHDLCPIARICTPGFRDMEKRHSGDDMRFMSFDVTGPKREAAAKDIDALGLRYALLGPPGAETGVVKVLDVAHNRVLCSAPGKQGLEQAEMLLAQITGRKH